MTWRWRRLLAGGGFFLGLCVALAYGRGTFDKEGTAAPEKRDAPAAGERPQAAEVAAAGKEEWPVFRGDPGQTGVAKSRLPDKLEVLWKFETGDAIEGTPAAGRGVVYVGSLDEHLYAIDLTGGTQKWKVKVGPVKAPVGLRDGRVYVGNFDGLFQCLDAADGKKRWAFEAGGEITSGANFTADSVLFASHDETLYCLDKEGKPRWKYKAQGPVYGTPSLAGKYTFVAGCDSALHVIDLADGKEKASVDLGGQSGATPAVVGDRLYVGNMGNNFLAVDWKKAAVEWSFRAERRAEAYFSSAAVGADLVVVGSRDKRVHALKRKDGSEAWSFLTGGRVDSSPLIDGGRVYVGSMDGKLYVLDLAVGKQLQKIELDAPVVGSPAVAEGRLLIGTTKGTLYCLGKK
jgi:outer membrane protein assembly factor BamB